MSVAGEFERRVLVAEDDDLLRRALSRLLRSRGHVVDEVGNGSELVARLRARPYAALVLDLDLPPPTGREVLRRCGPELLDTAVVVLSGGVDVDDTVELMHEGVTDVVRKPASLDAVLERLGHALAGRSPSPASRAEAEGRVHLLGVSPAMHRVRSSLEQIARFEDVSVLVQGETGTGKEVVARALHEASRPGAPFVGINCAAVPEQLAESQFFGHEAGAFTSATGRRAGVFEQAADGTLFLDEIGEMPCTLQTKLLRVLETRSFRRVGGDRDLPVRARIVSATNRPLRGGGVDATLRSDLFFRLAAFTIHTPALRERPEDIDPLARSFLEAFRRRYPDIAARRIATDALDAMTRYPWPGNVRELRNAVEQMAMVGRGPSLHAEDVAHVLPRIPADDSVRDVEPEASASPRSDAPALGDAPTLEVWEQRLIVSTFESCGRNVSQTARELGMARSTLRDRLRRYGVR